ncbi:type I polyketide synthase [Actinosynnema sp. ALI-1.44]|uniref:type I polyketide synthase n=1 Tax=Actinosynnema sp. ALI-1.44 TaxID=1933779 RepID=UPI001EDBAE72|nr:type I polyketide synthase [Actinosynnema sp. ALI-1.44]
MNEDKLRDYLKWVTADLAETRQRLRELESSQQEPIAIVSMSCRFPGGVSSPEELWRLVADGTDAVTDFPDDRGWDVESLYDPDPERTGTTYTREGGFVRDATQFDPALFGISPREALAMDPQQRLVLETAWELFERAELDPLSLKGTPASVFIGATDSGYASDTAQLPAELEGLLMTGGLSAVLSGRVSYTFGLEGPAVSIDTACSSSLVALHLAARSLRAGESSMAIAGGVSIMASPAVFVEFSRQGGLAADGRCRSFAATADGTGWAEGVGLVLLERLSDARRKGHQVLAVLRGSAINQDGASNGLTAPNGPAQQRVIRQALADARLTADQVDAVEAHGTGTVLGDPIEAQALLATYGQNRAGGRPLHLGSIKSNFGHAQAAAGVASVIKTVMSIRHGILPKTLHVEDATPHVDWSEGQVSLLTEPVPWPETGRPRRGAVSSFGVSGTNAHAIIEQDVPEETPEAEQATRALPLVPVVVSGRGPGAVRDQAAKLVRHIGPGTPLADFAYSLATTRAALDHRAVVVAADLAELKAGLTALAEDTGTVPRDTVPAEPRLALLFTGQGSQRAGMGRALHAVFPVFAAAFDEACGLLGLDPAVIFDDAADLDPTGIAQPALFALEVALFRLVENWGVRPDFVAGHSLGEISAAHVAGVLSLEDACALVTARGRLMQALPAGGAMVAVRASEQDVLAIIGDNTDLVAIASINGPESVVVSGAEDAVLAVEAELSGRGVRTRRLRVSHAFHSPLMDPMLAEFRAVVEKLTFHAPTLPVVSNVTGAVASAQQLRDPEYWVNHVRQPVRFADSVRALEDEGVTTFLELGPDGALSGMGQECLATPERAAFVPVLRKDKSEDRALIEAIGRVHLRGTAVDWREFFAGTGVRRMPLPTYAFQRQRFWLESSLAPADATGLGLGSAGHPLIGATIAMPEGFLFTARLSVQSTAWLADHVVLDRTVVPGTALVELAIRAGDQAGCGVVEELLLETPLVLPEDGAVQLRVTLAEPDDAGLRTVNVYSRAEDAPAEADWVRHATGLLSAARRPDGADLSAWPPAGADVLDLEGLYDGFSNNGVEYGPTFRGLRRAWRRGDEVFAEVSLPPEAAEQAAEFGLHPAVLDAALHSVGLGGFVEDIGQPWLPFAWNGVSLHATGASSLRIRAVSVGHDAMALDIADATGEPVATITSLAMRPVSTEQLAGGGGSFHESLFRVDWTQLRLPDPIGTCDAVGDLAAAFRRAGADVRELASVNDAESGLVAVWCPGIDRTGSSVPELAHAAAVDTLELVRDWLAAEQYDDARLLVMTRGAVAALPGEIVDLPIATAWGLLRSAQSENPGRLVLADVDGSDAAYRALLGALATDEPQLAVRGQAVYAPRLGRVAPKDALQPPTGDQAWHLDIAAKGTLENLRLTGFPEADAPLVDGEVRVSVRAAGLNFRDVLNALGMYPGASAAPGLEGAGVVLEVGPGVTGLKVGDRVMGLLPSGFGPLVVTDQRVLVTIPDGWSFAQAAATSIAFLTAYFGMFDLGGLSAGESVLIHSAAGGVGMAAVQLAQHRGAEVFATASPAKQDTVRACGVTHIASSRDLEFEQQFRSATGGRGVDVVLDSLAREFVDATLRLMPRGGRFIEMGKTDVRDPAEVADAHPGVWYRNFDIIEAGPDRLGEILTELRELFATGVLRPLPVTAWDIREAPDAFRQLSQARQIGKVALTMPRALDPDGTVLVTGASGVLAGHVARHLVTTHGVRRLLLTSRRGAAPELTAELTALGATVDVVACDVADRDAVSAMLAGIPSAHPLTGVVHAAGVLDDGVLGSMTPQRVEAVLRPKVDAAWHLHELTRDLDLAMFVLFSSIAATFGAGGQSNYAAANTFLDALAVHRSRAGLPVTTVAWGMWAEASGMTGDLADADKARISRAGVRDIGTAEGLALLDTASGLPDSFLVAMHVGDDDGPATGDVPPLLRGLVRTTGRRVVDTAAESATGIRQRLVGLSAAEQDQVLLELIRTNIAMVLGYSGTDGIDDGRAFKDLGFDSLTAVEMRNRMITATGLRLPPTLVFDYPTPVALTELLRAELLDEHQETTAPVAVTVSGADEPIAIIGMACRYPGGIDNPDDLWRLVTTGGDAISGFPQDRGWDLGSLYDADPDRPGTTYTREGGFLPEVADFDPEFFGISPREAIATDPQQRLLLEVAWEAFERAGIDVSAARGSRTGVFAGVSYHDYGTQMNGMLDEVGGYLVTGNSNSVASGRVSYTFGFEGPAVTVDTACSSSLVALHWAVQSLRSGECTMALAGGVAVMATPDTFIDFSRQRGLSADGRCKPFAAAADGTGWSEGVGMLLVERLSDAQRLGHRVLAVVRGSAINQDGASNGLTAPNGPSQQRVIRQALVNAGVSASEVDVVEAHGTGTTLGDPIEAQALLATYGRDRTEPLWLGSIKSNIGHTQAAAGVAGVIKMVQAMRHGVLPQTLHVDEPTPHVDWAEGSVELLTGARVWESGRPRRAGVSSFGFSGTNAHVILEQAPEVSSAAVAEPVVAGVVPWVLSGKSPEAVLSQALRLRSFVEDRPELSAVDVAYSLATSRAAMDQRAAVVGPTRDELLFGLASMDVVGGSGRVGVVFTGQGAQWAGMAAGLYGRFVVFTEAVNEICALMGLESSVVTDPDAVVDPTGVAQRVLFMIEVALWRQLQAWGLRADVIAGHSVGEIAAAHVAGVLSLEDACVLVSARARLLQALPEGGAMVAVAASEDTVTPLLVEGVSIAAINGPASVVLSGVEAAVDQVAGLLVERGVKTRRLRVSHAFHSALMEPMLADFADAISGIDFGIPCLAGVSTVTGAVVTDEWSDPGYWVRQVREPVRFADAVKTLDTGVVLEVGPDAVLSAMGPDNVSDDVVFIPTLRRGRDTETDLVHALARLHSHGASVDWEAFFAPYRPARVELPTYAFQRQRYWPSVSRSRGDVATAGLGAVEHPLLGAVTVSADSDRVTLSGRISLREQPWLGDHVVAGMVLLPGTAFVEMAVRAGDEVGCDLIEELTLQAPLVLPDAGAMHLQVAIGEPDQAGRRGIDIYSRPADTVQPEWTHHATGTLTTGTAGVGDGLTDWPPTGAEQVSVDGFYDGVAEHGLAYGPLFQGLRAAWRRGDDLFAEVAIEDSLSSEARAFGIHPALFDAALHPLLLKEDEANEEGPLLPFSWSGVVLKASGASSLRVHARADGALLLADSTGVELATVDSLLSRTLAPGQLRHRAPQSLYTLTWTPVSAAAGRDGAATLLRASDAGSVRDRTVWMLGELQEWLRSGEGVLVVATTGSVAAVDGDQVDDLAGSGVWGLVRSAQSEHPGRFVLLDTDTPEALDTLDLAGIVAIDEPQLVLRGGVPYAARLTPASPAADGGWGEGSVLVTGASGALGGVVVRHLVEQGVPGLLLVSRRGGDAPGMAELVQWASDRGVQVTVAAADLADREQVEMVLGVAPAGLPVTSVVHAAGVLNDGIVESLTPQQVDEVLAPKVDAAWNLHEATLGLELSRFVLFSSAAGVFGNAGQGNYAAANTFLDALAAHRVARGLPGTSLAWGLWQRGMGDTLSEGDLRRLARTGRALTDEEGMALFDATSADGLWVPAHVDLAAGAAEVPALLRGLVRRPVRRTSRARQADTELATRLSRVGSAEAHALLLELVCAETATVLGFARAGQVDPARSFGEIGFDSLTAVDLRNRLSAATGVRLPATLIFDYPNPDVLTSFLERELVGAEERTEAPVRVKASADEPIAIIGMACQYPGGVTSPQELWQLLAEGRDAISLFPDNRGWDLEALYDADPDHLGTSYTREGGFLHSADEFDSEFFGISPREATAMDPQQRLLLESTWEAFERAGIDPKSVRGSRTGVFAGVMYHDFSQVVTQAKDSSEGFVGSGSAGSILSGRVAYTFGLEGPAVTVDTACSSSLVALHLAAQALRNGECTMALAGGVTVMATPNTFVEFSRQRGLAADGRCKSFAGAADGTGWGEGVGMLLVERLSDARRLGHPILAVVRGSAVNQDGASSTLTAPNGPSQQRVIRQALANAGVVASDVDVVEAHGTGTTLGDPIEAQALLATYGQDRDGDPLWLGSIKSNIGHTQAAAGVAGVIKMVQAMRHGVLPRTLHVDEPTPHVDWAEGNVELLTESRVWEPSGRPRRAAVSSFGISGTNAHVILEQAPGSRAVAERKPVAAGVVPWVLSGRTPEAVAAQALRLKSFVGDRPELSAVDVSYSLLTSRASLEQRAAVVGSARDELLAGLDSVDAVRGSGQVGVVFTGQGAQWAGMAAGLYGRFPVFTETVDEICVLMGLDPSVVTDPEAVVDPTGVAQRVLFVVEVALWRQLQAWGLKAEVVAGHSVGEIAAAHVAGVLSLEDACVLVSARARLMQALPEGGAMVSVAASEETVTPLLVDGVSIAAVNGPSSVVLSGPEASVTAVADALAAGGVKTRRLRVSHAFHSALMEPMLADFAVAISDIEFGTPSLSGVSTVTGAVVTDEWGNPEYWVRQVREPVRFADAIATLAADVGTVLEIGPDAVLSAMGPDNVSGDVAFIPSLRRGRDTETELVQALARLHTHGVTVDWEAFFAPYKPSRVELPTYAFQRQRFWPIAGRSRGDVATAGLGAVEHPLLGAVMASADSDRVVLSGRISLREQAWLADHLVAGVVLLPGTAFVEMAVRAGDEVGCDLVEELTLQTPLVVPDAGAVHVQVVVGEPDETGRRGVDMYSRPEDSVQQEWTHHATGTLASGAGVGEGLVEWPPAGAESVSLDGFYEGLAVGGLAYGPVFQGVRAVWRRGGDVFAEIALEDSSDVEGFGVHPALLDAALHSLVVRSSDGVEGPSLPFVWSGVAVHAIGSTHARVRLSADGSIALADSTGAPIVTVDSLVTRALDAASLQARVDSLFAVSWSPVSVVAGDVGGTLLRAIGDSDVRVRTVWALGELQEWLRSGEGVLVVATSGSVAALDGDQIVDLAGSAVWGLVRSAQSEHPGRFVLVDTDTPADLDSLDLAEVVATGEPQLVLRGGVLYSARLNSVSASAGGGWGEGSVLVTGASGALGSVVVRHLVEQGVPGLVLVSRRGGDAPGMAELVQWASDRGVQVVVAAADVADRAQVEMVLGLAPVGLPVTSVVHAAGVLDDGMLESLTAEQVGKVFGPKVDAAWNLHEATLGLGLSRFVLFSSAAGVFGNAGQANYAAANSYLDALAAYRIGRGLPAASLAWGLWQRGMGDTLDESDRRRLARTGRALSDEEGMALFELTSAGGVWVPTHLDLAGFAAGDVEVPALLRGLVRRPVRRTSARQVDTELAARLSGLDDVAAHALLLDIVCAETATVLGFARASQVDPARSFGEIGFDSLTAVELRNRLSAVTGVSLPATLVFDYPNPEALAGLLVEKLVVGRGGLGLVVGAESATVGEPIAIVGMACRYPGGVGSPEELWSVLCGGGDVVSLFPTDRGWDVEGLYHPDPDHPGTSYAREGGFLHNAAEFDAGFFGLSPREAVATDPQQRLLLETSWEAFESAGIDPGSVRGSKTGVFAGVMHYDYASVVGNAIDGEGFVGTGATGSVLSGRVSYTFGFEGPAVTVDTACSSSLVSLHLAAQALRTGECTMALAGGVTVMATPGVFIGFSRQRGLAADGRCKPFAAAADGTGWSEGVGMLLLERLSDAKRNGHPVLAVVAGSAVNQDGASSSLTAPNGPSQQRVIRQALANAGVAASEVDVVEAHGTGTTLGDPIEAQALLATYGQERGGDPLWLGSVKSNLGHTQAAAGVAGVIKMVQAMRHGVLPQTLHVDEPTPHVDWSEGNVELLTESRVWDTNGRPRRAGVSSFGISGTNAHVILEQAPDTPVVPVPVPVAAGVVPWILSGKTPEAVRAQALRLRSFVEDRPELSSVDVAYSLATCRSAMDLRAAVVGPTREELVAGLASVDVVGGSGRVGVVFTGQGAQWAGMAAGLYGQFPVFTRTVDEICALMGLEPSVVTDPDAVVDPTGTAQRVLFMIEVALWRQLQAWGVKAEVVAGHSVGEISAAHVAGVLSLEDACVLVSARAKLMQALPEGGAMVSVAASEDIVTPLLIEGVSIAAVNGPASVVLSGPEIAVDQVAAVLAEEGVKTRKLRVSHAFHSALMEPMLADFADAISGVEFGIPSLAGVSTVTGAVVTSEWSDPGYWVRQVREPVRFADAVSALTADVVLEIGPDAVLSAMGPDSVSDDVVFIPTLRRNRDTEIDLVQALARLHTHGVTVDWEAFFAPYKPNRVDLPTYAFQRQHYWPAPGSSSGDASGLGLGAVEHPLLGAAVSIPETGGVLLTGRVSVDLAPWLADHRVAGHVLVPGTALVEMAVRAGGEVGCPALEELTLQAPLVLPESGAVQVQVWVDGPDEQERRPVRIYSRSQQADDPTVAWTLNASGTLTAATSVTRQALLVWPPSGAKPVDLGDFYERTADAGLEYGPVFQGLRAAWEHGEDLYAEVALPENTDVSGYDMHPALLDAALHSIALGSFAAETGKPNLPFAWNGVSLHGTGTRALRVKVSAVGSGAGLEITDDTGLPVASVDSLVVRPLAAAHLEASDPVFEPVWQRVSGEDSAPASAWALVGDHDEAMVAGLAEAGISLDGVASEIVVLPLLSERDSDVPAAVRAAVGEVLRFTQDWLADETNADSRLVVVTRGAVATRADEGIRDLAGAAALGLLRSAQSENPGRILLVDGDDVSWQTLPGVVTLEENQIALRGGESYALRLGKAAAPTEEPRTWDPAGTVLLTGASGVLGGVFARHLVADRGVRRLLLVSRRGIAAPEMEPLVKELESLGAEVTVAACDVADRNALASVLAAVDPAHPVTAVVHTAGVLDDGVLGSLTPERLDTVLRPKVDAAWNLHELTSGLTHFVLFSSAAGLMGGAGQANYAAANTFLDALAHQRRAAGLPATSLAWGLWAESGTLTAHLDNKDVRRMSRSGVEALTNAQGTRLFDIATDADTAVAVPVALDLRQLRQLADDGVLPPLLRGLVRTVARRPQLTESLLHKLRVTPEAERVDVTLAAVCTQVAVTLGFNGPEAIDRAKSFTELGFDSLTAVELRNRLNESTGLRLPATLVFDYPTPSALATWIAGELVPSDGVDEAETTVRELLANIPMKRLREAGLFDVLLGMAGGTGNESVVDFDVTDSIDGMDTDALIQLALEDAGARDANWEV